MRKSKVPDRFQTKLRLKMRTLHHDFGRCDECDEIAKERKEIVDKRMGPEALERNSERAKTHAALFMGERRALEALRLSSSRVNNEVLFCMRDKCGDDACTYRIAPRLGSGRRIVHYAEFLGCGRAWAG